MRKRINRKQRKLRWIRVRNAMRIWPECAYGGDFYCNHVYDPKYPWCWVDFRFFHTTLKRYFAVAMVTAEYEAYGNAEDAAWEIAEAKYPREPVEFGQWTLNDEDPNRIALFRTALSEIMKKPQLVKPLR